MENRTHTPDIEMQIYTNDEISRSIKPAEIARPATAIHRYYYTYTQEQRQYTELAQKTDKKSREEKEEKKHSNDPETT